MPIYERLSEGRVFNRTDFDQETFFRSVVYMVSNHCWFGPTPRPPKYTHVSDSSGREFWPKCGIFFLNRAFV